MDYMKDSITSPQDQHIESIGLKELVTTTTDVQVLRSNFNEESVIQEEIIFKGDIGRIRDIKTVELSGKLFLLTDGGALWRLEKKIP